MERSEQSFCTDIWYKYVNTTKNLNGAIEIFESIDILFTIL